MPRRALCAAMIGALLTGCASAAPGASTRPSSAVAGHEIVLRACAGCHAVENAGESPNPRAPAFRGLARRRSDAELTASLSQISREGHVEMPPIYVTPGEMAAVVAWMRSLTAHTI